MAIRVGQLCKPTPACKNYEQSIASNGCADPEHNPYVLSQAGST